MNSNESVIIFEREFLSRKLKNGHYSLRSFAKLIDMPAGRVSQILSGKRHLTADTGKKVAEKLCFSPKKEREFLSNITNEKKSRRKTIVAREILNSQEVEEFHALSDEHFCYLSEWYYYPLRELINLKTFKNDIEWMASKLDISKLEVRSAIKRMKRLGLIEERDGTLVNLKKDITTTHDIESRALKISHKKVLEMAADSIDQYPVEERDITSITMSIDPQKIPLAKELIKDFRRQLAGLLESGDQTEVYNFNMQLVPTTKLDREI